MLASARPKPSLTLSILQKKYAPLIPFSLYRYQKQGCSGKRGTVVKAMLFLQFYCCSRFTNSREDAKQESRVDSCPWPITTTIIVSTSHTFIPATSRLLAGRMTARRGVDAPCVQPNWPSRVLRGASASVWLCCASHQCDIPGYRYQHGHYFDLAV